MAKSACLLRVVPFLLLAPALRAQPPARELKVFGETIRYFDVGTGPVIVLVHGLGSSALGDWGRCMGPLSAHHRVVALDLLGFGGSDKPFIDFTVQLEVDVLAEFLRLKHVDHFTLVGESLGGWVAADYAIEALGDAPPPGPSFVLLKPDRLILCDAAGHRAEAEHMLAGGDQPLTVAGAKALMGEIFHAPQWSSDESVRSDLAWNMGKGDAWTMHSLTSNRQVLADVVDGKLGAIRVPTLIVWGQYDQLVPLDDGRDYAAKIPGARLVIIPNSGHAACIESPEAFLAAVTPFIDGK